MGILEGSVATLIKHLEGPDFTLKELAEGLALEKKGYNRKGAKKALRKAIRALEPVDSDEAPPAADSEYVAPKEEDEPVPEEMEEEKVPAGPKMVPINPSLCVFPFKAMDTTSFPYCTIHNSGMCVGCMRDESITNSCRVACEHPEHEELDQHTMMFATHAQVGPSPSEVEAMSLSEFDAEE